MRKTKQIKLTPSERDNIYYAGQHMSNWLYNMSQHNDFKNLSDTMKEMVAEWDKEKKALHP